MSLASDDSHKEPSQLFAPPLIELPRARSLRSHLEEEKKNAEKNLLPAGNRKETEPICTFQNKVVCALGSVQLFKRVTERGFGWRRFNSFPHTWIISSRKEQVEDVCLSVCLSSPSTDSNGGFNGSQLDTSGRSGATANQKQEGLWATWKSLWAATKRLCLRFCQLLDSEDVPLPPADTRFM